MTDVKGADLLGIMRFNTDFSTVLLIIGNVHSSAKHHIFKYGVCCLQIGGKLKVKTTLGVFIKSHSSGLC